MSRIAFIVFFALLIVPCISDAETIDVQIKGVDDGAKTTKQRDYKEAVLFAKREAIERAGVKIKSMTTVKDLVVNSDYIESKAEAVLLPGYNILDMGYSADGSYQVVLIGKVKTGLVLSSISVNEIDTEGWRYTAYSDGTVLDKKTQLMWAAEDNGENISWEDAKKYCEEFNRGGYSDWRLPTSEELEELKVRGQENRQGIYIVRLINITWDYLRAAEGKYAYVEYDWPGSGMRYVQRRVLPVRSAK